MIDNLQKKYEGLLEDHGLRRTHFRKDVLAIFVKHQGKAITNAIIEEELGDYDRITLYRTLKSFEDNGLIHLALDTTGQSKYALCGDQCDNHRHVHEHAHFYCNKCGETRCMDDISKNIVEYLPSGYQVEDIQITLSGICKTCH